MKNSFRKVFGIILFIVFEYISLSMYFSRDEDNYAKSINMVTYIGEVQTNITDYTKLKQQNIELNETIAKLQVTINKKNQQIGKYKEYITVLPDSTIDEVFAVGARVISQTTVKKDNIISINKGWNNGVEKGMTVISDDALVGSIIKVGRNYSVARSVLSDIIKTSAALKKNSSFCSVWWNGGSPYKLNFAEMTKYSDVKIGDTVITTSFSRLFSQNINIGVVSKVELVQNTYYNGEIKLFVDFKKLDYISIISTSMVDSTIN